MSKDGQNWIDYAEFDVTDREGILMSEEYHILKFRKMLCGYMFWRTEVRRRQL
jgi:hypothetical protein